MDKASLKAKPPSNPRCHLTVWDLISYVLTAQVLKRPHRTVGEAYVGILSVREMFSVPTEESDTT